MREQRNPALKRKLVELHEKYPAMGLDSLCHLLKPDFGCSRKRVYRQMRLAGISSVRRRSCKITTNSNHTHPIAPNLLQRNFLFDRPDQAWVGDITYNFFSLFRVHQIGKGSVVDVVCTADL